METDDQRCAEVRRFQQIDEAFTTGDLGALRAAVGEPGAVPNGPMPRTVGSCLVYAIYRSPLAFIRTLLDIGADPNTPVDDGFPPLIAALSTLQVSPGATPREDVDEILQLLLARGANPNQRGLNDYTPLHMAVAVGSARAVQTLLEGGADPELRTRIDECETPLQMARAAGLSEIAALLGRRGVPGRRRLRGGLWLLSDILGTGEIVRRQQAYRVRLRMWLAPDVAVRWPSAWGPVGAAHLEEEGATLVTEVLINRGRLISGLFYGMDGMRVGGTRRLEIAPHLAYRERGVPGVIPPNAVLTVEITVLEAAETSPARPRSRGPDA